MAAEIGILLAVLALLGWGAYPALLKKVIDALGEYTCLLFNHLVLVLFIGVTAAFTIRLSLPSDTVTAAIIAGALSGAIAVYLFYKAIDAGHVSVAAVVLALQSVWTVIISFFAFSERLMLLQYISILVILIGVIMAALEKPGLPERFNKRHVIRFMNSGLWTRGALLALLASFCLAFFSIAVKYSVRETGPHSALAYTEMLLFVFILFAFFAKPAKELVTLPKARHLKWLGPAAVLHAAGTVCFYFSMKYAPLSLVVPIVQGAPAVTAIVAAAFIGERIKVHQYAGIVLAVIGIVFLSM